MRLNVVAIAASGLLLGAGYSSSGWNFAVWPAPDASQWAPGLGLTNVTGIAGGSDHTMFIRGDGSIVWSWGGSWAGATNAVKASAYCHDLALLEREKPDDLRQVREYSSLTTGNMPRLFASVRETIADLNGSPDTTVPFTVQVGDLVEGLCGSAEQARQLDAAALAFLRTQEARTKYRVAVEKIALIGHSLSAFAALTAASGDKDIRAVASIALYDLSVIAQAALDSDESSDETARFLDAAAGDAHPRHVDSSRHGRRRASAGAAGEVAVQDRRAHLLLPHSVRWRALHRERGRQPVLIH